MMKSVAFASYFLRLSSIVAVCGEGQSSRVWERRRIDLREERLDITRLDAFVAYSRKGTSGGSI